jgi:hypothetical protein
MKTAMQELIDELERVRLMTNMNFVIRIANDLLEKEKEQIIDAYYGKIDGVYGYREAGEEYYNQTYKPETI